MKRLTILLISVVLTQTVLAQNYDPLPSDRRMAFIEQTSQPSMYVRCATWDSVLVNGGDSTYYNFRHMTWVNEMDDSTCTFWGGGCQIRDTIPGWLGRQITESGLTLTAENEFGENLVFDFSVGIGNTTTIYTGTNEVLEMTRLQDTVWTLETTTDSVRVYQLNHEDLSGTPVAGGLTGFKIKLSKNHGLWSFMDVHRFPDTWARGLDIIGITGPDIGFTKLTHETIYQYDVGDEIQYYNTTNLGSPQINPKDYYHCTILAENHTADSLIYDVTLESYDALNYTSSTTTTTLKYLKDEVIDSIPFDRFDKHSKALGYETRCGALRMVYTYYDPIEYQYCPDLNCWGSYDGFGQFSYDMEYVAGVGRTQWNKTPYGPIGTAGGQTSNIVYYNDADGGSCGSLVLSIKEEEVSSFNLYPNPASSTITIDGQLDRWEILDLQGRRVMDGSHHTVDVSRLESGVYVVVGHKGNAQGTTRFVKN